SAKTVSFGPTSLCGSRSATIALINTNCDPMTIDSIYWAAPGSSYTLTPQPVLPKIVGYGGRDSVTVRFGPTAPGSSGRRLVVVIKKGTLRMDTTIIFTGTGVKVGTAEVYPKLLSFASNTSCDSSDHFVYVTNQSCDTLEFTAGLT